MSRLKGFTLIEIVIVVFVLLLIMGLAVPSLIGVFADKRLHQSLDRFNNLVRQAHEHSLAERRAYVIIWTDDRVQVELAVKDEAPLPIAAMPIARGEKWHIDFPAALSGKTAAQWIFWESGVCEPARITFAGRNGTWTVNYPPLNALAEIVSYAPR